MLFLLLREATFLPTADKRNDKKCNFASENLITQLSQMGKLKELKELSLPTVAEELRQQSFWRSFLSSKTYVLTP